jgi:hypothetical protein
VTFASRAVNWPKPGSCTAMLKPQRRRRSRSHLATVPYKDPRIDVRIDRLLLTRDADGVIAIVDLVVAKAAKIMHCRYSGGSTLQPGVLVVNGEIVARAEMSPRFARRVTEMICAKLQAYDDFSTGDTQTQSTVRRTKSATARKLMTNAALASPATPKEPL